MATILAFILIIACLSIFFIAIPGVIVYSLILTGLYKITLLLIGVMVASWAVVLGLSGYIMDKYRED